MSSGVDLLIIHPHLDVLGGSERLTQILINELSRVGCEVVVLSRGFSRWFKEVEGVHYIKLRHGFLEGDLRLSKLADLYVSVSEVIKEFEPGHVLSMIQEPVYLVLAKLADPKVRTAIYIHFPIEEEVTEENLPKFIEMYRFPGLYESMYTIADLKLTNSNYTARVLYDKFGLESNVIYPAIPWDYYVKEPDLSWDPGPRIISVGRFVPHKRLDKLVRLFRERIKPEVREASLTVVGVPDERYRDYHEELRELAESTEDVELISRPLEPKELAKLYGESKAYVHLRIGEHFGMAPVEAMSQGTVPVLPLKSGLAELLTHGWDGFTYLNDEELLKYVLKVLKMRGSEYLEMRKRAYRKSLYFTPDRFASDLRNYLGIKCG